MTTYAYQKYLDEGELVFNEETAHNWGGPYEGNKARYVIKDWRFYRAFDEVPSFKDIQIKIIKRLCEYLSRKPKDRDFYEEKLRAVVDGDKDVVFMFNEMPSKEYPYVLYMHGDDDTSYSRWFQTEEEAREFLNLLKDNQPLDFYKDMLAFNFTFTN